MNSKRLTVILAPKKYPAKSLITQTNPLEFAPKWNTKRPYLNKTLKPPSTLTTTPLHFSLLHLYSLSRNCLVCSKWI